MPSLLSFWHVNTTVIPASAQHVMSHLISAWVADKEDES
jgi:hypothetical protein